MRPIGKSQKKVLEYLEEQSRLSLPGKIWISPTVIGEEVGGMIGSSGSLGKPHLRHGSWASPICKRLVEMGLVERNQQGHYRVKG